VGLGSLRRPYPPWGATPGHGRHRRAHARAAHATQLRRLGRPPQAAMTPPTAAEATHLCRMFMFAASFRCVPLAAAARSRYSEPLTAATRASVSAKWPHLGASLPSLRIFHRRRNTGGAAVDGLTSRFRRYVTAASIFSGGFTMLTPFPGVTSCWRERGCLLDAEHAGSVRIMFGCHIPRSVADSSVVVSGREAVLGVDEPLDERFGGTLRQARVVGDDAERRGPFRRVHDGRQLR
jgi:hypothetical protein